jgi:hypothetical protein
MGVRSLFKDTILSNIESLGPFNGIHSKHFGFHRLLSDRFPFGIYYRDMPEYTEEFAVLDLRRDHCLITKTLTIR